MKNPQILVLDFGSQYTQLIARRLREYGIYTEIVPYFESLDSIKAKNPKGIILSGGPASVYEEGAYKPDSKIFTLNIPILGICYGMQYITHFFGGSVIKAEAQEFGRAVLTILHQDSKNSNINNPMQIIQTEHCSIRAYSPNDFHALYALISNENTMQTLQTLKKQEIKQWLDKQIADYQKYGYGIWAVTHNQSGKMIGKVGIEKIKLLLNGVTQEVLRLDYLFDKEYQNKDYEQEIIESYINYAFKNLYINEIYSLIHSNNHTLLHLIQKFGGVYCGMVDDKAIWRIANYQIEHINHNKNKQLISDTLILRELTPTDLNDIESMLLDSEVMSAWGRALSKQEAKEWLDKQIQSYTLYGFGLWAVIEKSSGEMVGQCGITWQSVQDCILYKTIKESINANDYLKYATQHTIKDMIEKNTPCFPELGYIFKKSHWHKGLASKAAKMCMEYAFKDLGLPLLISLIKTDSIAPQNLAKRLEMRIIGKSYKTFDGVDIPHFVYMLKASDYIGLDLNINDNKKALLEFESFSPNKPLQTDIKKEILKIWRDSVSATHHFLTQDDIASMECYVAKLLDSLHIIIASDYNKRLGFIGLQGNKIEALFVTPSAFKKGIGKALIRKALALGLGDYEYVVVDCNEANSDAITFYHTLGFAIVGRSPKDEQNRDLPLVHFKVSSALLMRSFNLNYNMPLFETERLIVREMRKDDIAKLNAMLLDYEVMSSWEYNFNDSSVQEWLDTQLERYKKFGFGLWAVVEKQSGEMIGQAGLSLQKYNNKKVLGMTYIIAKNHWKKGYGVEVGLGCKNYAFHVLRARELYLLIKEDNEASKSVAKKLNAYLLGETTWSYRGREMQRLVYRIKNTNIHTQHFSLETNRTILRSYQDSDYAALKSMLQDKETMQAWNGALNEQEVQAWIEQEKANYNKFGIGWWVIVDKTNGIVIGQAGLNYTQHLEINYMLHKDHWHKGYAIEVALACKEYAFKHLRVKEVYSLCREDNIASQNVAKRIGMDKIQEIVDEENNVRYYEFRAISKVSPLAYTKYLYASPMESLESLQKNLAHLGLRIAALNISDSKEVLDLSALWQEYFTKTHSHLQQESIDKSGKNMQTLLKQCVRCLIISSEQQDIQAGAESEVLGFLVLHAMETEYSHIEIFLCAKKACMQREGIALLQAFMHMNTSPYIYIPCLVEQTQMQQFYMQLGFTQITDSKYFTYFKDSISQQSDTAHLYNYHHISLPCFMYGIDSTTLTTTLQSSLLQDSQYEDIESLQIFTHGNLQNNLYVNKATQHSTTPLFKNVAQDSIVWMSHADKVQSIPQGFIELAKSGNTHYCAIANKQKQIYALQFHPEVVHSEYGGEILKNFALDICKADNSWNMSNFAESEVIKLRKIVFGENYNANDNTISFHDITDANLAFICALSVNKEHEKFIESNADSINEAKKVGYWQTKAIYCNNKPIGFVMYDYIKSEDRVWIDRFMIDKNFSNQGFGKKAFISLIDIIWNEFKKDELYISVYEDNHIALHFYEKMGFVPNGERDRNNELIMVLTKQKYEKLDSTKALLKSHVNEYDKAHNKVLCAVSGGVDSSVVATLLYRAIGNNLIPVFVDTGLLRKGEREAVEQMFKEHLKVPLIIADAKELFLERLKGITEPEQKRKIIGETFIEVFEAEAKKHNTNGEIKFLAQGTLYPDIIESVSIKGPSKTIKSHHNVGGLPEWMKFELIEPLRELFKDEVRALGRELGMPESMLMRHPFPGPGLAIRIMGEVNENDLRLLKEADYIFIEELHKWGLYDKVWQAFCVLLNVRSVGVMGDNRTYDNTICVRAVEAIDGMTANFSHLPHEFLESVSNRIINEVSGINRVVYDITSKPPGTIEWE